MISPQRIVQWAVGVALIVIVALNWKYNYIGQNIINIVACSIFLMGFDNILIFYRCYIDEPAFELEATFLVFSLFVLGSLFQSFNSSPKNYLFINIFCYYLVIILLVINLLYFVAMFLIIFGYFVRHIFRLITNRLLSPQQVLDASRLEDILSQEKPFHIIVDQTPSVNTSCSICLLDFEKETLCVRLPECQHCFHKDCIQEWLKNRATCPYCRNNIILSAL